MTIFFQIYNRQTQIFWADAQKIHIYILENSWKIDLYQTALCMQNNLCLFSNVWSKNNLQIKCA